MTCLAFSTDSAVVTSAPQGSNAMRSSSRESAVSSTAEHLQDLGGPPTPALSDCRQPWAPRAREVPAPVVPPSAGPLAMTAATILADTAGSARRG